MLLKLMWEETHVSGESIVACLVLDCCRSVTILVISPSVTFAERRIVAISSNIRSYVDGSEV